MQKTCQVNERPAVFFAFQLNMHDVKHWKNHVKLQNRILCFNNETLLVTMETTVVSKEKFIRYGCRMLKSTTACDRPAQAAVSGMY